MHIVFAVPTFLPLRGGTEQTVHEWAIRLKANDRVTIITLNYPNVSPREITPEGIEVLRIPPCEVRLVGHLLRAIRLLVTLRRVHRLNRIDIIHLGHILRMGLGTMVFKIVHRIPVVATLLGADTYDPIEPTGRRYFPYMAFVMNRADRVVTMSTHMMEAARLQGCRKEIALIPHGATIRNCESTISIREKHGIPGDAKVCFSLQRLAPRKGLEFLLAAIPTVLERQPGVHFVIGGAGPLDGKLRELCRQYKVDGSVTLPGFIPDAALASYYDQADLFVLPTLYEAFGLVYVDSLSMGLPIVTTAVGGALDIVSEETGILVPPGDPDALADGVVRAFEKDWRRDAIKERAERYNWDKIVGQYVSIYKKLQERKE